MKNMRKLLSLVLAVVMVMSLAIPALAADFTDVPSDYKYYSAIQSLVARKVINGYEEDNTFRPENTITRAEFCAIVVRAIGLESTSASPAETGFPDVAAEHWASGYIKTARAQQIIDGHDDGTFTPEAPVTYEQAIKMTVVAKAAVLKTQAEKMGGYPQGYVTVANNLGFLKKIVDGVATQPAKRGTIAQLVDNMLKVDLSEQMGESIPSLGTDQMEEVTGQIVAVNGATIEDTATKLSTYQIKVLLSNGKTQIFDASRTDQKDELYGFLGKQVTIYYEDDYGVDVPEISSMSGRKNRNYEQVLGVDEIVDYSNSFVEYYDNNDREQKISISNNAVILFNGSYYDDSDFETLLYNNINKAGSIRFLSSDGEDAAVDIIFFTSYSNWFVTSVSKTSMTVYGEVNGTSDTIVIDTDDRNKTISIMKDGRNVDFDAIAKNQILSISESADKRFIEVLISSTAPSGKITGMPRAEQKLPVVNKTYTFASDLKFGDDIVVGATVKLYLDAFGKVAKYTFQAASDSYIYGYLMDVRNFGTSMESDVRVRLLNLNATSTKEPTDLKLASRVSINGKTYSTDTEYDNILALFRETAQYYEGVGDYDFADGEVYQVIKYTVSGGVVNSILIGKQGASETSADLRVNTDYIDGITCTTTNTTLSSIYRLSSSKVIFIPSAYRDDSKEYTIRNCSNSGFQSGSAYNVLLVDVSEANIPAVVIVYGDSTSASTAWVSNLPMVVTDKRATEEGYEITARSSASEKEYTDESGVFYDAVEIGDIVRIFPGSDGKEIEDMEVTMKASDAFNGTGFLQAGQADGRKVTEAGVSLGSTNSWIKEGSNSTNDNAQMSLMAGVAFGITEQDNSASMLMALDYPVDGDEWTKKVLGDSGRMASLNVANAKVISVTYKANGSYRIEDAEIGQISTYENVNVDASKLFVYNASGSTKLIIIFHAN